MMNLTSSDGNKYFWRTTKNPRQLLSLKPPPEYPHLISIYCLFCLPDTQLFNLSKAPYRLSEDLRNAKDWKSWQNNRYLQRNKDNRRSLHTMLNELHTQSKVNTYVAQRVTYVAQRLTYAAQRVTYVIEGRYIRRSTSYIRHRRSIHTPLNELHTSSKVDTYAAQRVTYAIEGSYIRCSTSYIRHRRSIQRSFFLLVPTL